MRAKNTFAFCVTLLLAATSSAQQVDFFVFQGWNHAAITGDGQLFSNIVDGLDVTVIGTGVFDAPSTGGAFINSSHDAANTHEFQFEFSQPVQLAVQTLSLDLNESYFIDGPGTEMYLNLLGTPPIETIMNPGLNLDGVGSGATAAQGITSLTGVGRSLTVRYSGVGNTVTKFSRIQVGLLVPEPEVWTMLSSCLIGLFVMRSKTRRSV